MSRQNKKEKERSLTHTIPQTNMLFNELSKLELLKRQNGVLKIQFKLCAFFLHFHSSSIKSISDSFVWFFSACLLAFIHSFVFCCSIHLKCFPPYFCAVFRTINIETKSVYLGNCWQNIITRNVK